MMLGRLAGLVLIIVTVLVASPVTVLAGTNPDITGTWDTEVVLDFDQEAPEGKAACIWQGLIEMVMESNPGDFEGSGDLDLTFNGGKCPSSVEGDAEGAIDGFDILFGFAGSDLGPISFEGVVAPDGNSMSGTWTQIVDSVELPEGGIFLGTWTADRVGGVPTLSSWGVIALIGLLLSISLFVIRRARV
jgi:hypothetical protein